MELLNRHFWKFFLGLLGLVAAGLFVVYGTSFYAYKKYQNEEVKRQAGIERLNKLYENDTYGGKTPEETLALFIDALKKGDTDLASRYFVIDKQEEWKKNLERIKSANQILAMINDIKKLNSKYPLVRGDDNRFIFEAFNESKELILQADIGRGSNGIWKILDL